MAHFFAPSLKSEKWCLPDQCPNSPPKSFIYCLKDNSDRLRIHKLHQCKQFQMIFGKQGLLYI